jgi:hypothetical protein
VPLVLGGLLGSVRPRAHAAVAAVIGDTAYVINNRGVINIVNIGNVNVVDGLVIVEASIPPISTLIPITGVAVTVVDATIEANRRTPIARVPDVRFTAPSPVTGRP